jgi:carbon monoxide dehydrogenase subunit G
MRVESSVVVNRPIEEIWAFMANPFNLPRATRFLRVRETSPGPMGLGSTLQGRVVFLGSEKRIELAVTEWDPPDAVAFAISGVGMGMRSSSLRSTLEATTDGTRVVTVWQLEPRPTLKPLWWILLPYIRRRMQGTDQKMKRRLEAEHGGGS